MRLYDGIFPGRERAVALGYDLSVAAAAVAVLVTQAHWAFLVALAALSLPAPLIFNSILIKRQLGLPSRLSRTQCSRLTRLVRPCSSSMATSKKTFSERQLQALVGKIRKIREHAEDSTVDSGALQR